MNGHDCAESSAPVGAECDGCGALYDHCDDCGRLAWLEAQIFHGEVVCHLCGDCRGEGGSR